MFEGMMSYQATQGEKLPIQSEDIYSLLCDNQEYVTFPLYVGDGMFCFDEGMKNLQTLTIPLPPNTKVDDFEMKVTMTINQSGLIEVEVHKVKDCQYLGKMTAQLDINKLDEDILSLINHVLEFF